MHGPDQNYLLSKYGVISGPYFPVFSSNTGEYGPEITLYLDSFHTVIPISNVLHLCPIRC